MAIERVLKFWLHDPIARARRIRRVRGFDFQSLESRLALSASPQIAVFHLPASPASYVSSQSALVQALPAHDALGQTRTLNTNQQRVNADFDATAHVTLARPGGSQFGIDPIIAAAIVAEAGNPGSNATSPANLNGPIAEQASGDSGGAADPPQPVPNEPDPIATPDPVVRITQTNSPQEEFDPGLLDPLAWTSSEDEFSIQFDNGAGIEDPLLYTANMSPSLFASQPEVADETGIGGYPPSLAVGARNANSFEMSTLSRKDFDFLRDTRSADLQSTSIMAGTMLSKNLLSRFNVFDQTAPVNHERFAELSPLEQSSPLALVATLWTMPSWTPLSSETGSQTGDRPDRHRETASPLSSWRAYVIGVDEAFERSCRDVCQGLTAGVAQPLSASTQTDHAGSAEWRMPVVPMAGAAWLEAGRGILPPDGRSRSNRVIPSPEEGSGRPTAEAGGSESPSGSNHDAHGTAEVPQSVATSVPIIALVTGSTLIAGWFWTRRASWGSKSVDSERSSSRFGSWR
jgi:hypothetical protein